MGSYCRVGVVWWGLHLSVFACRWMRWQRQSAGPFWIIRARKSTSRPLNRLSSQSQSLILSSGRDKVIIAFHYLRAETQTNERVSTGPRKFSKKYLNIWSRFKLFTYLKCFKVVSFSTLLLDILLIKIHFGVIIK